MKFRIENVGKVQFAEIEINGLTVLTGENSIGKSAIGKAIFSLVKSRNETTIHFSEDIILDIRNIFNEIIQNLEDKGISLDKYLHISINIFLDDLREINKLHLSNEDTFGLNVIKKYFSDLDQKLDKETKYQTINVLYQIRDKLNGYVNGTVPLHKSFNHLIQYVFNHELNNKLTSEKIASLSLNSDKGNIISIEVENNQTISFEINLSSSIQDVTIIESSFLLMLFAFVRNTLAFARINQNLTYKGLPYYLFDLTEKLSRANGIAANKDIFKNIKEIIGGKVAFDRFGNNFTFTDQSNKSYSILNTASGVKTFGLLQLLLSANCLNKQSLLIIDEPEVHLHPLWQLEYAKVLVQMAKSGIPILLASHSPYFIEALKVYSDKEIPDQTKFYFGEMREKGSVFKDVTNDLEPIFELLAIPMQQLIIEK